MESISGSDRERSANGGEQDLDGRAVPAFNPEDFKLWPPAPKTQILLIGIGFFVFNVILLVVLGALFWPR